jgi:hypothetical protein
MPLNARVSRMNSLRRPTGAYLGCEDFLDASTLTFIAMLSGRELIVLGVD